SPGGLVSGIPTQAGTFNFTVSATDSTAEADGGPITVSKPFQLTIMSPFSAPQITSLSPSSAAAGGAAFVLTVNGANFQNPATVMWNSTALTTTFVTASQLTAQVPASLLLNAGTALITVINTVDGQVSNSQNFNVLGPAPQISTLSPTSAVTGSGPLMLTVNGANFLNPATVMWNATALTTTFVNSGQL